MRGDTQLKERLIQTGIAQLTLKGVEGFSLREAAKSCGVSCAAPFKHFKDKQDFFQEISLVLDCQLECQLKRIEAAYQGDLWNVHLEGSVSFIEYLIAHPFLMNLSYWGITEGERTMGTRQWRSFEMVIANFNAYCASLNLSKEDYDRTFFSMQNITYGLPFMATAKMLNPNEDYSAKARLLIQAIFREYH